MQQNTNYEVREDIHNENGVPAAFPDAPILPSNLAEEADCAAENGTEGAEERPLDAPILKETDTHLEIALPLSQFNEDELEKIQRIVDSRQSVLKKALETEELPVVIKEETLVFPWFTLHGRDGEADAYQRLVSAIAKYAKEHCRVKETELVSDNDKYVMRMFLIRLGFNGEENKAARRLLLNNLNGNGSWKNGKAPAKTEEEEDA